MTQTHLDLCLENVPDLTNTHPRANIMLTRAFSHAATRTSIGAASICTRSPMLIGSLVRVGERGYSRQGKGNPFLFGLVRVFRLVLSCAQRGARSLGHAIGRIDLDSPITAVGCGVLL